jgi:hypothetical protein
MKLEVVGSSIFMVETELVSTGLYILKDEILEEVRNCVTDVLLHEPFFTIIG